MLRLIGITKIYGAKGNIKVEALKNINLHFRDNEFVSILGPSGSGKTTLLNIIGGLDRYDEGDLVINEVSTKKYKNKDWDSYRNHSIGFVFQSYNLIPHQSVLSNVELALTISGVSKRQRRKKAIEALEKVGLKEHIHKKPNQLSGGQMQRVAIARALVNNPDILLADEPTGALDTKTSIQIMELLKEVAKDRLVIMVTHNPELAKKYSTRIVNLKDGKIEGDSNPYEVNSKEDIKDKKLGKASMSYITAFVLSLQNLLTKKGRTTLTAIAGSIGIIGIALILSISNGFQKYIDKNQEKILTAYPLSITRQTTSLSEMLGVGNNNEEQIEDNKEEKENVKEKQVLRNLFSSFGTNDLPNFIQYLDKNKNKVEDMVSHIQYKYDVEPQVFTRASKDNEIMQINSNTENNPMSGMSFMNSSFSVLNQMLDNKEILDQQYDVIKGHWPENYDEVILVLTDKNTIPDVVVYGLGLRDPTEITSALSSLMKEEIKLEKSEPLEFTYEQLMEIPLKLIDVPSTYKFNEEYSVYENMLEDKAFLENLYNNSETLKIVGIVVPKEGKENDSFALSTGIGYTSDLTKYVIEKAKNSEIVKKQLENEEINVLTGKRFDDKSQNSGLDFQNMITVDTQMLSSAFGMKIDEEKIANMTQGYIGEISNAITTDISKPKEDITNVLATITKTMLDNYIDENGINGVAVIKLSNVNEVVQKHMATQDVNNYLEELEGKYLIPKDNFKELFENLIKAFLSSYIVSGNNLVSSNTQDEDPSMVMIKDATTQLTDAFVNQEEIVNTIDQLSSASIEAIMQKTIITKVSELTSKLMMEMGNAFNVDEQSIANAFKFNLDETQMRRLMESLTNTTSTNNATENLKLLGYQELDNPLSLDLYFKDFNQKQSFIDFVGNYNTEVEKENENKVIKYEDLTEIIMSSVKTIINGVSYILIAFVSISLIVSSIMIGIITYISVLERKKEIGILRAIGASKKNISSIFNAETFIIGLFAGIIGIGITNLLLIPINNLLVKLTKDTYMVAILPNSAAIALIVLSVILTLIGGIIPSKHAANKDPVEALRSE